MSASLDIQAWEPNEETGGDMLPARLTVERSDDNEVSLELTHGDHGDRTIYFDLFTAGRLVEALLRAADTAS